MLLRRINVAELIGRTLTNANGAEFQLTRIDYNLGEDRCEFWIAQTDERGQVMPDTETGIYSLQGWEVD